MLEVACKRRLDPDRSQLRRVLEVQVAYERMRAARFMLVHLLAFVGVVIWIVAISPDLLPQPVRLYSFVIWGSFLFLTIWVALEEYILWRKLTLHKTQESS